MIPDPKHTRARTKLCSLNEAAMGGHRPKVDSRSRVMRANLDACLEDDARAKRMTGGDAIEIMHIPEFDEGRTHRPWWRRRSVWLRFCEGWTIVTVPGMVVLILLAWFGSMMF